MRARRLLLLPVLLLLAACQPYLHIDRLGIHDRIVPGGQAQIDAGEVTYMFGNLLAAHRTSHGSEFRNLPAIQVGERFWTTGFKGNGAQEWVVVSKSIITTRSASVLNGWPLVLQTSMPGGALLLVFCRPA